MLFIAACALASLLWSSNELSVSAGDDMSAGKLVTGTGDDLDVFFVLVSGYLVRILISSSSSRCAVKLLSVQIHSKMCKPSIQTAARSALDPHKYCLDRNIIYVLVWCLGLDG